jgi:hypothetical protein
MTHLCFYRDAQQHTLHNPEQRGFSRSVFTSRVTPTNTYTAEFAQTHFIHLCQHLIQNVWLPTVDMLNYLQQFSNPKAQLSILHAA